MELSHFINQYVSYVAAIDEYFRLTYKVDDVLRAVRISIIPKQGEINLYGTGKYSFHGIGCAVVWDTHSINYDYCPPRIAGGFSEYDLMDFIRSIGDKLEVEEVNSHLQNLERQGLIVKGDFEPKRNLYFKKATYSKIMQSIQK